MSSSILRRRRFRSLLAQSILFVLASISVFITFGILFVLVRESIGFFDEVSLYDFLTDTEWTPMFLDKHFGIMPLLSGTLMSALIALVVAVPCGLILAIYISEFASERSREIAKPILELLAGIPTVAFGYFALFLVTPALKTVLPELSTFNLLSPGIVMGFMILPYIVSLAEDALRMVPRELREGGFALGLSKFQCAIHIVFPAAFSGVATAVLLGVSRAVGETMVVAIAAGQRAQLAYNPLEGAATITAYIVQVSLGDVAHGSLAYQTIFVAGLTLFLVTVGFNLLAHALRRRFREAY